MTPSSTLVYPGDKCTHNIISDAEFNRDGYGSYADRTMIYRYGSNVVADFSRYFPRHKRLTRTEIG